MSSAHHHDAQGVSLWLIDQIEAGWATLSPLEGAQAGAPSAEPITLPVALLPQDAREGDALTLALSIDAAARARLQEAQQARLQALSADDDGGDFSL